MGRMMVVMILSAALAGCGGVRGNSGDGAANASAASGAGLGPNDFKSNGGAFGPDQLSPSRQQ